MLFSNMYKILAKQILRSRRDLRYSHYDEKTSSFARFSVQALDVVALRFLEKLDWRTAIRLNAEIAFSRGNLRYKLKWQERILLTGVLSAFHQKWEQAAHWLSAGCARNWTTIERNSYIGDHPCSYVTWFERNQPLMTTSEGWVEIFEGARRREEVEDLLACLSILCVTVGLKLEARILARLVTARAKNFIADYSIRAYTSRNKPRTDQTCQAGRLDTLDQADVSKMILGNISGRIRRPGRAKCRMVSQVEEDWISENDIGLPFSEPGFLLACRAMQRILRSDYKGVVSLLKAKVKSDAPFIQSLDARIGPNKVFIGGFGWSGSSAVFDAFLAYEDVFEMGGPGDAPYLNVGADSEPMVYQGPAGISEFVAAHEQFGTSSRAYWRKFSDLYVLATNQRSYFEYKTVSANRLLRDQLGYEAYYALITRFLFDYAKLMSGKRRRAIYRKKAFFSQYRNISPVCGTVARFGDRLVKACFPNDKSTVLFNNAINTHNISALRYVGGKTAYIAVDRSVLDQMADQRQSNQFFKNGAFVFGLRKFQKLSSYCREKSLVSDEHDVAFFDCRFEDWVQDAQLRRKISTALIGRYDEAIEKINFDPSVSVKNIGIAAGILSAKEMRILKFLEKYTHPKIY